MAKSFTRHLPLGVKEPDPKRVQNIECEILVVGGGTGGTAAALAAASQGRSVCLTEETDWLGGQLSSQGVSAPDENRYIEFFGGTKSYYRFRKGVREYYQSHYTLSEKGKAAGDLLNPGGGWVSRLCYEPEVGVEVIEEMLAPLRHSENLQIFYHTRAVEAEREGDRVVSVLAYRSDEESWVRFHPKFVLDATELGDLLPLTGTEYSKGAEPKSETNEPQAHPGEGHPDWVQSYTYTFAVEYRPGESHVIPKPDNYEENRDKQPYTFGVDYGGETGILYYKMFEKAAGTYGSFWTYRRLIEAANFADPTFPNDIAMINWPGNDFVGGNLIDKAPSEQDAILKRAKDLSLGFLYWLQTEAPRDDGGKGYPELLLRKDVMGTEDGLSKYPYIRESRRIKALKTVVEHEIAKDYIPGPLATFYPDSCGLGLYFIDIHASGYEETAKPKPVYPFQIPTGALIPRSVTNLLAGCKNLGVTHITNGTYRLHPIEWNIGESAGHLASFCLEEGALPKEVWEDEELLHMFQAQLLAAGIPLYWLVDVGLDHPAFTAVQTLAMRGVLPIPQEDLKFTPEAPMDRKEAALWLRKATGRDVEAQPGALRGEDLSTWGKKPGPAGEMTRAQYALWLVTEL